VSEAKQTVLVTGGAGFLGINLVRALLANGWEVVSYDIALFDYPERDRVRAVTGDVRDAAALRQAMDGCAQVVHCAAALPLYSEADIRSTDVDGTRNVLEAARDLGLDRVVYISSTAVYGVPDHHPLYETDRLVGVGPYGESKVEAEGIIRGFRNAGLCVPVIRPKSFVGPERLGIFALLYDWAKDGHGFPLLGNGKNRYQLLDVEDMCDAILLCMTLDCALVNDDFNIGAAEYATMREDWQAVLDEAGFGKKVRTFPEGPVIAVLKVLEALHLSPVYKWVYETAGKDSFVSIEKAQKVLGYRPKYSNQDALIRNYHWYLENLETFQTATGVSHRVPWNQGILRLFKCFF
jgi:nucleoside-diphosphate-sugar epimerase